MAAAPGPKDRGPPWPEHRGADEPAPRGEGGLSRFPRWGAVPARPADLPGSGRRAVLAQGVSAPERTRLDSPNGLFGRELSDVSPGAPQRRSDESRQPGTDPPRCENVL